MTHLATLQTIDPSITVPANEFSLINEEGHLKSVGAYHVGDAEKTYFDLLRNVQETGQHLVALTGPSGAGKTALSRQLAAMIDVPFVALNAVSGHIGVLFIDDIEYQVEGLSEKDLAVLVTALTGPAVVSLSGDERLVSLQRSLATMTPGVRIAAAGVTGHVHFQTLVCLEYVITDAHDTRLLLSNRKNMLMLDVAARNEDGSRNEDRSVERVETDPHPSENIKRLSRIKVAQHMSKLAVTSWHLSVDTPEETVQKLGLALNEATARVASAAQALDPTASDDDAADFAAMTMVNFIQNAQGGDYFAHVPVATLLATLPLAQGLCIVLDWQTREMLLGLAKRCI